MNAVAIQYIWQAIQESERSDDLPFINTLNRLSQHRTDQSGAMRRESIMAAVTEPHRLNSDSLSAVTLPPLLRP